MYYEEKMINGVMHWRGSPDGEFTPFTIEEISERYEKEKENSAARAEFEYGRGQRDEKERIAGLLGLGATMTEAERT